MKVQIYTIQSVKEADSLVKLGVDNIGLTPASIGLPGEISIELAKEIFLSVKSNNNIALSVSNDIDEIQEMIFEVNPDILHLCGEAGAIDDKDILTLKSSIQSDPYNIKIMQAISVDNWDAVDLAKHYSNFVDYLILDTSTTEVEGIGASGDIHDWDISKAIVENVNIPVVLAGGLSPENVKEAIVKVSPWGVDSLTHTNKYFNNGKFTKDLKKVERFIKNSKK
jgi:phosphoribosylanthranilate isomerase|tara:strand:+ start:477 stop:1148 length:672 start_codon:yes stop_codon:yes gene_type:complete